MRRFLILSGFMASFALMAPVVMTADDHHEKRYYDKEHKDYHQWNGGEDHAYRIYLGERHEEFREFHRIKPERQREYFKWRHDHPDSSFKVEIR